MRRTAGEDRSYQRPDELSVIDEGSGDNNEPFPFVPGMPAIAAPSRSDSSTVSPASSTIFHHRRGLQEEANEQDLISLTSHSLQEPKSPHRHLHKIYEHDGTAGDIQLGRASIKPAARTSLPVQNEDDHGLAINRLPSQGHEPYPTSSSQVAEQWLALEYHPRLQRALIEEYQRRREEKLVQLFSQQYENAETGLPSKFKTFQTEQANALENFKNQFNAYDSYAAASKPRSEFEQTQWQQHLSHNSSSSVAMGVRKESRGSSVSDSSGKPIVDSLSSDQADTEQEPSILPPPSNDGDSFGMDSRFSKDDFMTDVQWKALHSALKSDTGSINAKWQTSLKLASNLPSRPLPASSDHRRTVRHHHPPQQSRPTKSPAGSNPISPPAPSSNTSYSTGMIEHRAHFVCDCCLESKFAEEAACACINIQFPHVMCSQCATKYLWASLPDSSDFPEIVGPNICRVSCFAGIPSSNPACSAHVDISLHRLMEPPELEQWKEQRRRHQANRNRKATTARRKQTTRDLSIQHAQGQIEQAMKEALAGFKARNCPTCQQEFEKDATGCNRIRCTRCGASFCFVCRNPVSAIVYDHFDNSQNFPTSKCPLFSDKEMDHKRALEEVRKMLFGMANQVWEESLVNATVPDGVSKDSTTSSVEAMLAIIDK
eukprot:scaffold2134_cov93-Cylindrotheca_fusiformis.AAC.14